MSLNTSELKMLETLKTLKTLETLKTLKTLETLEFLYTTILSLTDQYQIKDDQTILTVEKLNHDKELGKKIDTFIKTLGDEIILYTNNNITVPIKYKQLYNIYTKTNKIL
jgi:hypothetical protein